MALPNPIPAACSLHRSQRLRTGRGGQEAKLERGRLRSVRCCKVVQMPAVPTAPGTETVCPQPSYTTSVSEAYCNQIPGPAGGAVRRVTITETLLRHSVQAQQWGIQLRAWRRSWASGPRPPPRLPGCTGRCCSGRVSGNHATTGTIPCRPQRLCSFLPWCPGFFLPIISKLRRFSITPCSVLLFLLSHFFFHLLPSSWCGNTRACTNANSCLHPMSCLQRF